MELNNIYTVKNKPIKQLLDNIDNFMTNIVKFNNKHKGYSYHIEINRNLNNELWSAEIEIKHEKQEIKTAKAVVEPPTLL